MTSAPQPRSRPRHRLRIGTNAGGPVPRESWDLGFALTITGTKPDEPTPLDPRRRPTDR